MNKTNEQIIRDYTQRSMSDIIGDQFNLTIVRTKEVMNLARKDEAESILSELLEKQQEVISSPIRFTGVSIEAVKQIFEKHGVDTKPYF